MRVVTESATYRRKMLSPFSKQKNNFTLYGAKCAESVGLDFDI